MRSPCVDNMSTVQEETARHSEVLGNSRDPISNDMVWLRCLKYYFSTPQKSSGSRASGASVYTPCALFSFFFLQNQHEENHPKDLYAQVKPSRLRRAEPTSPFLMPKEPLDSNNRQAKEDKVRDHQVGPDLSSSPGPSAEHRPYSTFSHSRLLHPRSPVMWPMPSCTSWLQDKGSWTLHLSGRKVPLETLLWCLPVQIQGDTDSLFCGGGRTQGDEKIESVTGVQPFCRYITQNVVTLGTQLIM